MVGISRSDWILALTEVIDRAYLLDDAEFAATSSVLSQILSTIRVPQRGAPEVIPPFVMAASLSKRENHNRVSRSLDIEDSSQLLPPRLWAGLLVAQIASSWPDLSRAELKLATEMFSELFVTLEATTRSVAELPPFLIQ